MKYEVLLNAFELVIIILVLILFLAEKKKKIEHLDFSDKMKKLSDKHLNMFLISDKWIRALQEKKNLGEFLQKQKIQTIAIYGMGYLGKNLYNELKDSPIEVKFFIDKKYEEIYAPIIVRSPNELIPEVDLILITAMQDIEEIKNTLILEKECKICSLGEIIDDWFYE